VPADLIVIEIAAPSVSDEALAVLVSACTRAARLGECVIAKNAPPDPPTAVAIVSFQAEDKVRVEVGVRRGEHDAWRAKDFAFLAADDTLERFRAIGFAIGTLAESDGKNPDATPAPPAAPAPIAPAARVAPPPPPVHARADAHTLLFVEAKALFGPGLDVGPWRLGSSLGAEIAPARLPVYFSVGGTAATRVARDASGAAARWFDVSAGVGISLLGPLTQTGLELEGALLAEHFDVAASTIDGDADTASRWLLGAQVAMGGRVQLVPGLFLTGEVQAAGLSAATDVRVTGTPIGTADNFRYLGSFGLRVRLR